MESDFYFLLNRHGKPQTVWHRTATVAVSGGSVWCGKMADSASSRATHRKHSSRKGCGFRQLSTVAQEICDRRNFFPMLGE